MPVGRCIRYPSGRRLLALLLEGLHPSVRLPLLKRVVGAFGEFRAGGSEPEPTAEGMQLADQLIACVRYDSHRACPTCGQPHPPCESC